MLHASYKNVWPIETVSVLAFFTLFSTKLILQPSFVCVNVFMYEYCRMTVHFPVSYHSNSTCTSFPVRGRELPVPEGETENGRGEATGTGQAGKVWGEKKSKKNHNKTKLMIFSMAGEGEKSFQLCLVPIIWLCIYIYKNHLQSFISCGIVPGLLHFRYFVAGRGERKKTARERGVV